MSGMRTLLQRGGSYLELPQAQIPDLPERLPLRLLNIMYAPKRLTAPNLPRLLAALLSGYSVLGMRELQTTYYAPSGGRGGSVGGPISMSSHTPASSC